MFRSFANLSIWTLFGVAFSALFVLSVPAHASCTIQITAAFTCDQNADRYSPKVGDADYMRANWTITGAPKQPYTVTVTMANQAPIVYPNWPASAGHWWIFTGGYIFPLNTPIPYTITIDSTHVTGNTTLSKATISGTFTPVPPLQAIQYFAPQTWNGSETFTVGWNDGSGTVTSGYTLLGCPATGTFQTVNQVVAPVGGVKVTTTPSKDPVWKTSWTNFTPVSGFDTWTTTDYFNVTDYCIRTNPSLLEAATWAEIASLPAATYGPYLGVDSLTQSTDPSIAAYVNSILPANYKTTMTPYAAAEAIFLAEDRDIVYEANQVDIDAVSTLAGRTGNCGGMSDLYDACLRAIGIPARMDCGFWQGTDMWHCFSEFYLPNGGWVPADTSQDAEWWDQTGTYPYMFAADTERNTFCCVSRGTVHQATGFDISDTQVGWIFWNGTASSSGYQDSSSLTATQ